MSDHAAHAPISLYLGRTFHERAAPKHRFRNRLAMIALDLDRLGDAGRQSALFSVERFNLFSFRARDHGPRDGSSLSVWARAHFAELGVETAHCRIRLLCAPRVLGYVFDPIALYLAEGPNGLRGVIYQVHNTFGDAHAYGARLDPAASAHRHRAEKVFHVSPFFDVGGAYAFTLRPLGERFSLVIDKQRADGTDFRAAMALKRKPLTTPSLLRLFASQPFSTLKTIAAIHWQALRLWIKGARYHKRPKAPGGLTPASAAGSAPKEAA